MEGKQARDSVFLLQHTLCEKWAPSTVSMQQRSAGIVTVGGGGGGGGGGSDSLTSTTQANRLSSLLLLLRHGPGLMALSKS